MKTLLGFVRISANAAGLASSKLLEKVISREKHWTLYISQKHRLIICIHFIYIWSIDAYVIGKSKNIAKAKYLWERFFHIVIQRNVKFLFSKLKCKKEAPLLSSQIKIDLYGKEQSCFPGEDQEKNSRKKYAIDCNCHLKF